VPSNIEGYWLVKGGSLFSGVRGLDVGAQAAVGGELAWCVEYDSAPSKVLEYHWPDTANHGDVTKVDWSSLEPVDYLTGGYPCQPFSTIGKRLGEDDVRHLWPYYCTAIRELRPRFAILENVAGHLSLGFDIVQRDLAEIGWDAEWISLPASAAGAPHNASASSSLPTPRTSRGGSGTELIYKLGGVRVNDKRRPQGRVLLPTPTTSEATGVGAHGTGGLNLRTHVHRMLSGASTSEPSSTGSPSPDVMLLGPDILAVG